MQLFVEFQWLIKHQITGYFWYINNIHITYDQSKTIIGHTLMKFSKLKPTIGFVTEKKSENSIRFLDYTMLTLQFTGNLHKQTS
jgi:hypothetical protein